MTSQVINSNTATGAATALGVTSVSEKLFLLTIIWYRQNCRHTNQQAETLLAVVLHIYNCLM